MSNDGENMPETAMVLAAGLGVRMRPLTAHRPKPLIEVAGRTMIDRALDRIAAAGIKRVVVNIHYLADMLRDHLAARTDLDIALSDESDLLLETGGGIAKALPQLGDKPFLAVNADTVWIDAWDDTLQRLAASWDDGKMDALLLMQPTIQAVGYDGRGDYQLGPDGRLERRPEVQVAPYVFTGVQMLHPRLFAECPEGPFSMNVLYDKAEEEGRLFGLRHQGDWLHIGTATGLAEAEAFLKGG